VSRTRISIATAVSCVVAWALVTAYHGGKPGDATHVFVLSLIVSSVGRPSGAAVCGG